MITLLSVCYNCKLQSRLQVNRVNNVKCSKNYRKSSRRDSFFYHFKTLLPCFPAILLSPHTALFQCLSLTPAAHNWSCLAFISITPPPQPPPPPPSPPSSVLLTKNRNCFEWLAYTWARLTWMSYFECLVKPYQQSTVLILKTIFCAKLGIAVH